MLKPISKYLALYHHLNIPGVGSFNLATAPAALRDKELLPPGQSLLFTPGTALTDKRFYEFLSAETGLSEVDAVRRFQDYAYELRKRIQAEASVRFGNWGTLSRPGGGEIVFEQEASADLYFPAIDLSAPVPAQTTTPEQAMAAEAPVTVAAEEEVAEAPRRDPWWLWTLLLALAALAAIVYYYMSEQA